MPERVQRKRTKGWRMPLNAIYVGRPSIWGNPFYVRTNSLRRSDLERWYVYFKEERLAEFPTKPAAQAEAVRLFDKWFDKSVAEPGTELYEFRTRFGWRGFQLASVAPKLLHGKTLVCWCGSGVACHADVIIRKAN